VRTAVTARSSDKPSYPRGCRRTRFRTMWRRTFATGSSQKEDRLSLPGLAVFHQQVALLAQLTVDELIESYSPIYEIGLSKTDLVNRAITHRAL